MVAKTKWCAKREGPKGLERQKSGGERRSKTQRQPRADKYPCMKNNTGEDLKRGAGLGRGGIKAKSS